jgi:hypothetical protein
MAHLPAMRTMFSRLGLSAQAAHFMVHDQSIDSLAILTRITDDQIDKLCSICRKPGGMIRHPNTGTQIQGSAVRVLYPDEHANPGISVAALHAENMKLAAFHLRLMTNVSRACEIGDITIADIESV